MDPDAEFEINCLKCGGAGRIAGYVMDGGRCWRCDGSGRERTTARKEAQRKRRRELASTRRERERQQWFVDEARKRQGMSDEQRERSVRERFTVERDGTVGVWRDEPGGEVDQITVAEMAAREKAEDAILLGEVPDPTPAEPDVPTAVISPAELDAADDVTNQRDTGNNGDMTDTAATYATDMPRSHAAQTTVVKRALRAVGINPSDVRVSSTGAANALYYGQIQSLMGKGLDVDAMMEEIRRIPWIEKVELTRYEDGQPMFISMVTYKPTA